MTDGKLIPRWSGESLPFFQSLAKLSLESAFFRIGEEGGIGRIQHELGQLVAGELELLRQDAIFAG
ncbi:hypothetical protein D3C73_1641960 [compost metagenome]